MTCPECRNTLAPYGDQWWMCLSCSVLVARAARPGPGLTRDGAGGRQRGSALPTRSATYPGFPSTLLEVTHGAPNQ